MGGEGVGGLLPKLSPLSRQGSSSPVSRQGLLCHDRARWPGALPGLGERDRPANVAGTRARQRLSAMCCD